ncbi:uncharacterized protein TEOVI_000492100 [Trypanosoma equiperdum]|uniref:Uncharacterized protein n=1 Tax=Trypanosoma equiperdum TaxID=5694 RepID=A0A1G4I3M4_TRYEQ|nr:hypothetical protein, conserved [Trypanosoma equiperdum]
MISESQMFSPWRNSARDQAQLRSCALAAPSAAASRYIHRLEEEVSALTQHYNTACHLLHRAILVQDLSSVIIDELEGRSHIVEEESTLRSNMMWLCMSMASVLRRTVPQHSTAVRAGTASQVDSDAARDLNGLPERIINAVRHTVEQGSERVSELVSAVPRRVCMALSTEDIGVNRSKHNASVMQNEEYRSGFSTMQRQLDRVLSRVEDILSEFNTAQHALVNQQRDDEYSKGYVASLQTAAKNVEDLSTQVAELLRQLQQMRRDQLQHQQTSVSSSSQPQLSPAKVTFTETTQTTGPLPSCDAVTQTLPQPEPAASKVESPATQRVKIVQASSVTAQTQTAGPPPTATTATQTKTPPSSPTDVTRENRTTQRSILTAPLPTVATGTQTDTPKPSAAELAPSTDKCLRDSRAAEEWKLLMEFAVNAINVLSSNVRDYVSTFEKIQRLSEQEIDFLQQVGDSRKTRRWESLLAEKSAEIVRLNEEVTKLDSTIKAAEKPRTRSSPSPARSEDNNTPSLAQLYAAYSAPFIPPKLRTTQKVKLLPTTELLKAALRAGARSATEGDSTGARSGTVTPKSVSRSPGKSGEGSPVSRQGLTPDAKAAKKVAISEPNKMPFQSTPNAAVRGGDISPLTGSRRSTVAAPPAATKHVEKRTHRVFDDDTPVATPRVSTVTKAPDTSDKPSLPSSKIRKSDAAAAKSSPRAASPPPTSAVSIGGDVVTVRKFKRSLSSSSSSSGKADTIAPLRAKKSEGGNKESHEKGEDGKPKDEPKKLEMRQLKKKSFSSDSLSVSLSDVPVTRPKVEKVADKPKSAAANNSFDESSDDEPKRALHRVSVPAKNNERNEQTPSNKCQDKPREKRWSETSSSLDDKEGGNEKAAAKKGVSKNASKSTDTSLTLTL